MINLEAAMINLEAAMINLEASMVILKTAMINLEAAMINAEVVNSVAVLQVAAAVPAQPSRPSWASSPCGRMTSAPLDDCGVFSGGAWAWTSSAGMGMGTDDCSLRPGSGMDDRSRKRDMGSILGTCMVVVWQMQVLLVASVSELMVQAWLGVVEVASFAAGYAARCVWSIVRLCLVQFRLRGSSRTVQCQRHDIHQFLCQPQCPTQCQCLCRTQSPHLSSLQFLFRSKYQDCGVVMTFAEVPDC